MLFIALDFALILGPPIALLALQIAVPTLPKVSIQMLVQTLEIAGLLCIIYALRMEP